jgi:hypothetical protein
MLARVPCASTTTPDKQPMVDRLASLEMVHRHCLGGYSPLSRQIRSPIVNYCPGAISA